MGEANFYYFTCLNFERVKFWLNRHNDALFPRSRESRQVGQGAWRQLARPLQEHARSRKSHQGNGAQTRHQVPQECLREKRLFLSDATLEAPVATLRPKLGTHPAVRDVGPRNLPNSSFRC